MFLFFTIVFITYYLYTLINTNPMIKNLEKISDSSKELLDDEISYSKKKEYEGKIGIEFIKVFVTAILLLISEFIYLLVALKHDPTKIPTMLMIAYTIYGLFFNNKNKAKKTYSVKSVEWINEVDKITEQFKHRTFKQTIITILNIAYFAYMFYLIVF